MYLQTVPRIRQVFEDAPTRTLVQVVDFVLATIQQRFHTVQDILDTWHEWEAGGFEKERPGTLWGMKHHGFQYVRHHKERLSALLLHALERGDAVDAIDTLLEVPGLGIAKSGFVAQLIGFRVGCLDTHNLEIYEIAPETFATYPKRASARLALIESYVTLCEQLGGSEALWDRWCHLIADQQALYFDSADDVSDAHLRACVR